MWRFLRWVGAANSSPELLVRQGVLAGWYQQVINASPKSSTSTLRNTDEFENATSAGPNPRRP